MVAFLLVSLHCETKLFGARNLLTLILFTGNMNHPPNMQAIEVLFEDILPELLKREWKGKKYFKVHIVASNFVSPKLRYLMNKNSDIAHLYHNLSLQQV